MKARLRAVKARLRPSFRATLLAQGANVVTALAIFVILSRTLTARDFGVYAALTATYAVAIAAVGTSLATSFIDELAGRSGARVAVSLTRDLPACLGGTALVAATGALLGAGVTDELAAALGFAALLVAEIAGGVALGQRRFGVYSTLVVARCAVWLGATAALVLSVPHAWRLAAALFGGAVAGLVPLAYLVVERGLDVRLRVAARQFSVPLLGVTQVGLWIVASSDRVILARFAPLDAAVYAMTYGLMDRGYRALASAEVLGYLPERIARRSRGPGSRAEAPLDGLVTVPLIGAIAVVAAFATPTVVRWLTGGAYEPSLLLSALLAFGLALMPLAARPYADSVASGRLRGLAAVAVLIAVANVVANLALVPRYGAVSAACATLACYAAWLVAAVFLARGGAISATSTGKTALAERP